jgi:tetratricopeptide (TPR) repeat protein
MPVEARAENVVYRCGKFLRRHRLGAMAAGVVALTLTMGLASTLWQAHRAEVEKNLAESRQQEAERQREIAREEAAKSAAARMQAEAEHAEADRQRGQAELQKVAAETQRGLAERRFGQVRELARKFLFDFGDAIAALPGATPARKMVVATGVRYYDSLVAEAAGNRDLLEEIARGYGRLGDVQGNVYFANLGDGAGAELSYKKALAIQAKITDPSPEFLHDRIMSYIRMAQIMIGKGDSPAAVRYAREALALGAGSPALETYTVRDAQSLALSALGDAVMESGDISAAIEPYSKLLALRIELARTAPDEVAAQRGISNAEAHLGDVYFRSEHPADALQHLRAALVIDERLSAAAPGDFRLTRKLRITYSLLAEALKSEPGQALAQPGETTKYLDAAMGLAGRMLAVDPDNIQAMRDFVLSGIDLADWLRGQKDPAGSAAVLLKAQAAAQRFSARELPAGENGVLQQLYRRLANTAIDAGHFDEAMEDVGKADTYAIAATKENPAATVSLMRRNEVAETRALVYAAQKRWDPAIGEYNAIIAADQAMSRKDPENQMPVNDAAEKYALLADCYAQAGQRDAAVRAMQTAVDTYNSIAGRRSLGADEENRLKEGLAKLSEWQKN